MHNIKANSRGMWPTPRVFLQAQFLQTLLIFFLRGFQAVLHQRLHSIALQPFSNWRGAPSLARVVDIVDAHHQPRVLRNNLLKLHRVTCNFFGHILDWL